MGEYRDPDLDRRIRARDHLACQVDPGDQWADPGDLAIGARREPVLVVDARPGDPDLDLARRQIRLADLADASLDPIVVDLLDDVRTERGGNGSQRPGLRIGRVGRPS